MDSLRFNNSLEQFTKLRKVPNIRLQFYYKIKTGQRKKCKRQTMEPGLYKLETVMTSGTCYSGMVICSNEHIEYCDPGGST